MSDSKKNQRAAKKWKPATVFDTCITDASSRAAIAQIDQMITAMAERPRMWGSPCCVEEEARGLMAVRRTLLGVDADAHPSPIDTDGVYDNLRKERFGVTNTPAYCHLRDPDERVAGEKIGDFLAEWWRRERETVPSPP